MMKKLGNVVGNDSKSFDVIIDKNSSITGSITSVGSVRIDGTVNGDIKSNGNVIIGTDANVIGNISANNIEISGTAAGDILSNSLLKIYETGKLEGNIEVMSFMIEEGGFFKGNCLINSNGLVKTEEPTENKNTNSNKDTNKQEKSKL
jgi:cytoskeletal protein CcmA (bactofilin family)